MEQLVILDWVFLLVLLVSLCLGLMSGLVQAVIALGSWFVSYGVAQWGAKDVSVMLPLQGYEPPIPFMLAFALLFIASFMACTFVSWLLQRMLEAVGLRPIDRLLGGMFGFIRGFLILVVVVSVVHLTPVRNMQWWQQSKGQEMVLSAVAMFSPLLPQEFTRYLPQPNGKESKRMGNKKSVEEPQRQKQQQPQPNNGAGALQEDEGKAKWQDAVQSMEQVQKIQEGLTSGGAEEAQVDEAVDALGALIELHQNTREDAPPVIEQSQPNTGE